MSDDVRRTAKYRTAVVIRTFTDLPADSRHRCEEYLRIIKPARSVAAVVTHSGESGTAR